MNCIRGRGLGFRGRRLPHSDEILDIGLCGVFGELAEMAGYPFKIMRFTPLLGGVMVLTVSIVAAALSARPVLKLQPVVVFAGR